MSPLTSQLPGGIPNVLAPRGVGAAQLAQLGWILIVVSAAVLAVVLWGVLAPLARRLRPDEHVGVSAAQDRREHRLIMVLGVVVPALILLGTFLVSLRGMGAWNAGPSSAMDVQVIGHQWWWEVRYPKLGIVSANEIHIPAHRKVRVSLLSSDVIHSFWVPQLRGKLDLIPGQVNRLWIEADHPGAYRGECSEYCGLQHAHMDFTVVAQEMGAFQAWVAAQQRPATPPTDPAAVRGKHVFHDAGCAFCHTVTGDGFGGTMGPDLTHVASRATLGAGTFPNRRGQLAGWIVNAQQLKPGIKMPNVQLSGDEVQALVAYLERLR
jgi:cytochrome c oxidase subunit 2